MNKMCFRLCLNDVFLQPESENSDGLYHIFVYLETAGWLTGFLIFHGNVWCWGDCTVRVLWGGKKIYIKVFFSHSYFIFHEMAVRRNVAAEKRILISFTTVFKVLATVPTREPAHLSFPAQPVVFSRPLCHISELAFRFGTCCCVCVERTRLNVWSTCLSL